MWFVDHTKFCYFFRSIWDNTPLLAQHATFGPLFIFSLKVKITAPLFWPSAPLLTPNPKILLYSWPKHSLSSLITLISILSPLSLSSLLLPHTTVRSLLYSLSPLSSYLSTIMQEIETMKRRNDESKNEELKKLKNWERKTQEIEESGTKNSRNWRTKKLGNEEMKGRRIEDMYTRNWFFSSVFSFFFQIFWFYLRFSFWIWFWM